MAKNINHVSHKKSRQKLSNGMPQLPSADAIVEGEIAVNFAEGVETLSIKNESGDVVTFSSDNFYTEQKLGSAFTGENSAKTVTDVIESNELVISSSLNDLKENKLDVSAYTPTDLSNYYTKSETSGATEIQKALNGKADASDIADFFDEAKYEDSGTTKVINFYHGNTIKATIDASDFIVDGMVDNVVISGGSLVIDFNTASGKQDISIPLTDIFDPSSYYDKTEIDSLVGSGFTSSSITDVIIENEEIVSNALTDLDERKLDASAYTPSVELWVSGSGENAVVLKGGDNTASGTLAVAEGSGTTAEGYASHAEGFGLMGQSTMAIGNASHAEGIATSAITDGAHSEGFATRAIGSGSHAEGWGAIASGNYSHAEGVFYLNSIGIDYPTTASGDYSHAEGGSTMASGDYSHSEGEFTITNGEASHAEGNNTTADGKYSHSEGENTDANGEASHAEGYYTIANGEASHAEGSETIASNDSEHASGQYNVSNSATTEFGDSGNTLFSVGNGTSTSQRHNAFEIRQNGDIYIVSGNTDIKLQDHIGSVDTITAITPLNSGSTDPIATKVVAENELTVSNALIDLDERKLDASAYTPTDLSNYYTKSETSGATEISNAFDAVNISITDLSGQSETVSVALNYLNENKADLSAVTPVDLSNYYTKSETSGATEISNALGGKVNSATFTGHTADTAMHFTTTEKTNLDSLATNIAAISGITSTKVGNWDTAYTNNHTHSNKTALDSITGSVGTMAYQNASSYSSATQVNTALEGKVNTSEYATFSAETNTSINDLNGQSETIAAALNVLNERITQLEEQLSSLTSN